MDDEYRRFILAELKKMVMEDFGLPSSNINQPFCTHCMAHQAVKMLDAVYEDLEADQAADDIITTHHVH